MARPKTKKELLDASDTEFAKLQEILASISPQDNAKPGVCDDWSVKDIVAHLHAWHMMMLDWYEQGMKGEEPAIPGEGYTWKDTPKLNAEIYQRWANVDYKEIMNKLAHSHQQVMRIIRNHSDRELFTKKKYTWTGSTSLGAYLISATSSHYNWASKLIKKWLKGKS